MSSMGDRDLDVVYLRDVQYRDSTQLAKRANLHVAYRTAPQAAFDWFAGLIEWPANGRVLDVGCGAGYLWEHVAPRSPSGIELTLVDLSAGMVAEAVERATGTGRFASVEGRVVDARWLPFHGESFDVVVSTYALYHVPEPQRAVTELARVVRSDGLVAVMTNGPGHLAEIQRLRVDVYGDAGRYGVNDAFPPPLAAATLVEHFDEARWARYDDTLLVTDADDLLAFVTSTPPANQATPDQLDRLRELIAERSVDGVFTVSKDTGALIARRPRKR
jgi:SAM-dependent methyltransferase